MELTYVLTDADVINRHASALNFLFLIGNFSLQKQGKKSKDLQKS